MKAAAPSTHPDVLLNWRMVDLLALTLLVHSSGHGRLSQTIRWNRSGCTRQGQDGSFRRQFHDPFLNR